MNFHFHHVQSIYFTSKTDLSQHAYSIPMLFIISHGKICWEGNDFEWLQLNVNGDYLPESSPHTATIPEELRSSKKGPEILKHPTNHWTASPPPGSNLTVKRTPPIFHRLIVFLVNIKFCIDFWQMLYEINYLKLLWWPNSPEELFATQRFLGLKIFLMTVSIHHSKNSNFLFESLSVAHYSVVCKLLDPAFCSSLSSQYLAHCQAPESYSVNI